MHRRIEYEGEDIKHPSQLIELLRNIGYEIDSGDSFNYTNRLNPGLGVYKARYVGIREADTKKSPFHYLARRDENFQRLQGIRRSVEFTHNNRVWEL